MGWVYNLKDPNAPTHAPRLIAICLVFSTAAFIAVALRFYVRYYKKGVLWWDDWAALSSAVLGAAYSGIAIAQTRWGQALDPAHFPPENTIPFSKIQYSGGPVYTLALLGFKLSLLTSYLRIGGFVKSYAYAIYAVIVLVICNQIIFTFVICFGCNPVAKQWDPTIPGTCIDTIRSYYAIAGTSLGFDVIIILLPIPVLLKLQLYTRQKAVLIGLFCLGFFVTVIQIIRIFTIKNLKSYTNSEAIVIWSIVEISLGVIIPCIPTYGPLFRSFSQAYSSYRYGRSREESKNTNTGFSRTSMANKIRHSRRFTNGTSSAATKSKSSQHNRSLTESWTYDLERIEQRQGAGIHTSVITSKMRSSDGSSDEQVMIPGVEEQQFNIQRYYNNNSNNNNSSHEPIQIHTTTDVTVESHHRDEMGSLKTERGM
ncbi:hypothetical protein VTN00DRAFT_8104 [Thermoascus crustaceus]|uniref:uncharacterized protein n=1 Tax=Thermoascus crustaceus TaxID=5088 RepID=UPI0037421103